MNLLFGIVAAVLAVNAVAFLFRNSNEPGIRPPQVDATLPQNRPPIDFTGRIAALQQMLAREPQNAQYLTEIGNLYYDSGDYGKAVDYYQRSLSVRPRDSHVETDLATCYHYLGQHDKSLEILGNVLTYNPGFVQAQFNKGIVLIEGKKDIQGGIATWEELLRSNPNYSQRAQLEQRIQQLKMYNR